LSDSVNAIEIEGVTKDFRSGVGATRIRALNGINLQVEVGEVTALLGANGSGKSTLLKIILGLLAPTAGECRVFGVPSGRVEARSSVGYLPEAPDFYPSLTGFEVVRFFAQLGGLPRVGLRERVMAAIADAGMARAAHRRIATYSQGMKQRIGLAQALVTEPKLLILDEPTSGVDPDGAAEVGSLICRLKAKGRTVLLSSHNLEQVEAICDRAVMLDRGRLVATGRVNELVRRGGGVPLGIESLPENEWGGLRAWLEARGGRLHEGRVPQTGLQRLFREAAKRDRGEETGMP
jgi:ABC-2 type transport system ATP-binding protein